MTDNIETFFNYLLDTEATSEITFNEIIHKNNELFHSRYLKIWETLVNRKLQQLHPNSIVPTLNNVASSQKSEINDSPDEDLLISSSNAEKEDEDKTTFQKRSVSINNKMN